MEQWWVELTTNIPSAAAVLLVVWWFLAHLRADDERLMQHMAKREEELERRYGELLTRYNEVVRDCGRLLGRVDESLDQVAEHLHGLGRTAAKPARSPKAREGN